MEPGPADLSVGRACDGRTPIGTGVPRVCPLFSEAWMGPPHLPFRLQSVLRVSVVNPLKQKIPTAHWPRVCLLPWTPLLEEGKAPGGLPEVLPAGFPARDHRMPTGSPSTSLRRRMNCLFQRHHERQSEGGCVCLAVPGLRPLRLLLGVTRFVKRNKGQEALRRPRRPVPRGAAAGRGVAAAAQAGVAVRAAGGGRRARRCCQC